MAIRIGRYRSTLAAIAAVQDVTIRVKSTSGLPALDPGDHCYLSLLDRSTNGIEVVKVTDWSGTTLTVERSQSGTTAKVWPIGTPVALSNDPVTLTEYIQQESGTGSIADFAEEGKSWGELDELGISDVDDGARLVMQRESETEVKHITFGQFSAKIEDGITIPQGGITSQDATNIANTRIEALRPNAFTTAEQTKLAGIESGAKDDQDAAEVQTSTAAFGNRLSSSDNTVQKALDTLDDVAIPKSHAAEGGGKTPAYDVEFPDIAPDGVRNIKNIVGELRTPAMATATFQGGGQSQERIWSAEFTIDGKSVLFEYRPVTAFGGTGTNPGEYILEGPANFLTDLIPGRGAITRIFLGVGTHNPFGESVTDGGTTPFDDPGRREIRGTRRNSSDPDGLAAPADQTSTPTVSMTLDFEFEDGTNFYDGELQPRVIGTVFTADNAAELQALVQARPGHQSEADVDAAIAADVKEYARTGQRKIAATDLQIKPEEAVNAFEGDGWSPVGGVTLLRATAYTAGTIAGAVFAKSQSQGPHLTNNYVGIRIPIADKDDLASHRLYIGENDGEDYHTVYPGTGWTHLADDAAWAYYSQQVTDHPAGDWFGVQSFETLRLDDAAGAATVDAVLVAGTGLTKTLAADGNSVTLDVDGGNLAVTGVKDYARTGGRKIQAGDLDYKGEEIVEAFDGEGWAAGGGVSAATATAPTASNIGSLSYQEQRVQSPRAANYYVACRIPIAQKDSLASWRLVVGEDISDAYRAVYLGTGWTHVHDGTTWAYYYQQVPDIPQADEFGLQVFDQLRLDDEAAAATVDAVLRAGPGLIKTTDGTTVTLDAVDSGGNLSSVASDATLTGEGTSEDPLKVSNPFTDADETKLDGIETGATADQSGTEIRDALEGLAAQDKLEGSALKADTVTGTQLADQTVGGNQLAGGAVTTDKVVNNAITEDKLALDSVTAGKIADSEITPPKLNFATGQRTVGNVVTLESTGEFGSESPRHSGAHLQQLVQRVDVGVVISDANNDRLGIPVYIPLSTLDIDDIAGVYILDLEWRFDSGGTIANFGFTPGTPGDSTATDDREFDNTALLATPVYQTGGAQEGLVVSQNFYSGSTKIGSGDFRLTRAADGRLGYYLSYDSDQTSVTGGVTARANVTLSFLRNDAGAAGVTPSSTPVRTVAQYESKLAPSLSNTNIAQDTVVLVTLGDFLSGSDNAAQGLTRNANRIVAERAGNYLFTAGINLLIHDSGAGNKIPDGTRSYVDVRFFKVASVSATETIPLTSSQQTEMLRRADNSRGSTITSPAAMMVSVTCPVKLEAGEAVGIQLVGRHFTVTTRQMQVAVSSSESELTISSTETVLGSSARLIPAGGTADQVLKKTTGTDYAVEWADDESGTASLTPGSIGNAELADGAVTAPKIAEGAVGTSALATGAVNTSDIADDAVNGGQASPREPWIPRL